MDDWSDVMAAIFVAMLLILVACVVVFACAITGHLIGLWDLDAIRNGSIG